MSQPCWLEMVGTRLTRVCLPLHFDAWGRKIFLGVVRLVAGFLFFISRPIHQIDTRPTVCVAVSFLRLMMILVWQI